LTDPVCDSYKENLEAGNCAVEMVNHVKWDVVRGKEKVTGKSVPYANQHMKLKEPRQTIFVPMPDNIWLGAFAGEEESCNNFAALKEKELLSPPAAPVKKRYKEGNCRFVRKEQRQLPSTFTHVSDFHYCGCDIPGFTGVTPSGVQSTSSYVCD
jgi:hypothetical protein